MMVPTIVRPWESGSLRKILAAHPLQRPSPERPLVWVRPFEEIVAQEAHGELSQPAIRLRPFQEIVDESSHDDQASDIRIQLGSRRRHPSTTDACTDAKSYHSDSRIAYNWRSHPESFRTFKSEGNYVTSSADISESSRSTEISANVYQIHIPDEQPKTEVSSNRNFQVNEKAISYQFEKIIDFKPAIISSSSLAFPEKYSARIGTYYECPRCYNKYVSCLDVSEHLVYCQDNDNYDEDTLHIPEVELVDLEEEEDEDDNSRDPDFVPPTPTTATPTPAKSAGASKNADGKFICSFAGCKRMFTTRAGLAGHRRLHKVSKNIFKCPECSSQYSWKAQLKSHLIRRHPNLANITNAELDKYRMLGSGSSLVVENTMRENHAAKETESLKGSPKKQRGSSRKGRSKNDEEINFCTTCNIRFASAHEYLAHGMQHRIDIEKSFTCKVCNRAFFRRAYLIQHEMSHNR